MTDKAVTAKEAKEAKYASMHPVVKFVIEFGPLIIFFFTNSQYDIFTATMSFMVATVLALGSAFIIARKLPLMPMLTGAFVMVFGGLTIYLNDETFIKIKPTITNSLFSLALFGGLAFKRPLLRIAMGSMIHLDHDGWIKLTWRWAFFMGALAILNEVVWRNFSTDFWVSFKVFGIFPLTMVFVAFQIPLVNKHMSEDPKDVREAEEDF